MPTVNFLFFDFFAPQAILYDVEPKYVNGFSKEKPFQESIDTIQASKHENCIKLVGV